MKNYILQILWLVAAVAIVPDWYALLGDGSLVSPGGIHVLGAMFGISAVVATAAKSWKVWYK